MDAIQTKPKTHPLFIAAAGSVIIFSALGSAAIMGWLPKGGAEPAAAITQAPATSAPVAATATATVVATPAAPVAAPAPAPVAAKPAAPTAPRVTARADPRPVQHAEHQAVPHETPQSVVTTPPVPDARRPDEGRVVLAEAHDTAPPLPPRAVQPICHDCGVVESVNEVEKAGDGSGLGAVAGGVVGAIAGKQVGGGRGRNVMSVLGAVGGAYAGHQIEKNARKVKIYEITVRFEDGATRTISQPTPPAWRAGDKVRLINGAIQPNA